MRGPDYWGQETMTRVGSSPALDRVLDRLDGMRRNGSGYRALCPAHDDHDPSLDVSSGQRGVLVICRSQGCSLEAIVAALGLTVADLFDVPLTTSTSSSGAAQVATKYIYRDEDGTPLFEAHRLPNKEFRLRLPGRTTGGIGDVRRVLDRLPEVIEGVGERRWIIICEGEKDAERVAAEGFVATTNPMGAGKWKAVRFGGAHRSQGRCPRRQRRTRTQPRPPRSPPTL